VNIDVSGKRAFISGSTQGIGLAIAEELARNGAAVVLNGRHPDAVDRAVTELRKTVSGAEVSGIAADFSEPSDVDRLLDELPDIDILVNNVGVFELAAFDAISDETWRRFIDINLMSAVRLSRHVLPRMLGNGWGRILLISSESGVNVPADMIHYGVTKAAMLALGNGLAKLTRGTAVTVNTILGGPTYSAGVAQAIAGLAQATGMSEADAKATIISSNTTTLLERFIEPHEIAALAAYLASPAASATNGAALRADGGVLTGML
jgi:NAD(P)-dependent dehydrogenase (short-subunit alcohol dehydrogenase family)